MYAVTGAAGNTGRATLTALVARGERVRAIVRNAERGKSLAGPGVDVVVADMLNPDELARAMTGARGAYLVRPPATRADGAASARAFRQALEQADVERVVVLSSIGAQHAQGTGVVGGLHDLEEELGTVNRPVTFLRAASFLENWLGLLPAVQANGVLPSLLPADFAYEQVAVADIGTAVASLLVDGTDGRPVVGVDGPANVSPGEIAAAVGRKLGRTVPVFTIPVSAQQGQLEAVGVPGPYAKEVVELYVGILDGTVRRPEGEFLLRGNTTLDAWVDSVVRG
jgi:uncharacterized protein YbjT (DUF2867 family)